MYDEIELERVARASGADPAAFKAWVTDPEVVAKHAGANPAQLVGPFLQAQEAVKQAQTGQINVAQIAAAGTPQVSVSAKRPGIPTTVNPYAGTTQETANPDTPNASAISQFDPAALKAAQAQYDKERAAGAGFRAGADVLSGFGLGSSGGATTKYNQELQQKYKDQLFERTIGAQEALQKQATAGQAALTSAQNREESAGKFTGTQREMQQKLDIGQLNVETQKRLNDPNSKETALAKKLYVDQLRAGGRVPTKEDMALLANATAQNLLPALEPKILDAFKAAAGLQKSAAETAQAYGQAAQATGLGKQAVASAGKIGEETRTAKTAADVFDVATAGGTKIPQGMNTTLGPSGVQMSPNQQVLREQEGVGAGNVKTEEQIKVMKTLVEPVIDTTMADLQKTYTGKGAAAAAAWKPGDNNQVKVAQQFARINQLYPEALPAEVAASIKAQSSKPGWNGELSLSLSPTQAMTALSQAKANMARIDLDRQSRLDFQRSGGNPVEYSNSEQAQKAARMRAAIDPKTMKIVMVDPENPADVKLIQSKGLRNADNFKIGQ